MGRPVADNGREGGGGMGRPVDETGPAGRGGGTAPPGASGRPGGAGVVGRAAGGGGAAGRPGVGRPLEMNPPRGVSPVASAVPAAAGAAGAGASTTGATVGSGVVGAGAGVSATCGVIGATGVSSTTSVVSVAFFATAFFATAFFAGSFLAGSFFAVSFLAAAFFAGFSAASSSFFATAFFATAFFAVVFFSGLGSSGCSSRIRPSRSARWRTRSACCSMIDDEWLFTSMPIDMQRSTASLLVRPSSLASSWTRMFFAKLTSAFPLRPVGASGDLGVLIGDETGAQSAPQRAPFHRHRNARRFAAQPRTATVRDNGRSKTTVDDDVTRQRAGVESTTATHARACRTMAAMCHASEAPSPRPAPPAHSFSLMTEPSAACHSISPVASLVTH